MQQNSLMHKAVEVLVRFDKPILSQKELREILVPLTEGEGQLRRVLHKLSAGGYTRRLIEVTNRARRVCGKPEIETISKAPVNYIRKDSL